MPSGYESGAKKTIDISIKAEKMTADVLKSALQEFLSGKAEKKGRMTFKQFIRLLCAFSCLFYREGGKVPETSRLKNNNVSYRLLCCQILQATCKRTCANETKAYPTIHNTY